LALKTRSATRPSDCEFIYQWISEAAYYYAESRNFIPGMELDDWLIAENDFVKMQIMRYQVIIQEDGGMTVIGLQRLAKSLGVESPEMITLAVDLIHAIQKITHNNPCFNFKPETHCDTTESCLWKAECKKLIAKWQAST
jgi:hypothetical protein